MNEVQSSCLSLYQNLIKKYQAGEISFKDVKSYNLDEYDYRENIYELLKENQRLQEQEELVKQYKLKIDRITNSKLYKLYKLIV